MNPHLETATALYAAIHFPERVRAVIMLRPPTAWKERLDRRKILLGISKIS
jgi:pimeloyl-ACP methyl ester carboxylesterase